MKILILTRTIAKNSGGGRYSRAVLDEYLKRGIEFTVLTEEGYDLWKFEKRELARLNSPFAFIKNIFVTYSYSKDCDVVHAFDGWPFAVYGYIALLFRPRPLFVNAVGTYAVANLKSPVKGFFLRRAYLKAKKVFAISEFVKKNVLKYIVIPSLDVVYLGTTPMKKPEADEVEKIREKYGINRTLQPILLTVGALKDRKGQLETVKAVSILKKNHPGILYIIVGSSFGAMAYENLIREYVRTNGLESNVKIMTEVKSDEELACLYTLSDIFILNSKHHHESEHSEGFGLVLLEAAQFGKPVVGSSGSGIPEAMEVGRNGYLVDEVEAEAIASAVTKVLANYEALSSYSPEVAKKFTWEKTAAAYIKEYCNHNKEQI